MARTAPVPAGQPPDATRTAAGQVLTLAVGEAVAARVAACVTLAALLWPLIPAARAVAGLAGALGRRLPPRPHPEQEAGGPTGVVVVMPGSGGAGRAAAASGGRPGTVHAAGAVTLGGRGGVRTAGPVRHVARFPDRDHFAAAGKRGVR